MRTLWNEAITNENRNGVVALYHGNNIEVLRTFAPNSIDAVVTDPPYGLSAHTAEDVTNALTAWIKGEEYTVTKKGFMGKTWDSFVPGPELWKEVYRVLKPGGHCLVFAGSRTSDLMGIALRLAGFEIRDEVMWIYGCLDEATKVATAEGVKSHRETKVGDLVMCYNTDTGTYSYQPVLEIVEYDYEDTAYRLIGDLGEQVVSRNHRCIVERDGKEVFQLAETLQHETYLPFLENLPALQQALHDTYQGASHQEQGVQCGVCEGVDWQGEQWPEGHKDTQRKNQTDMPSLWGGVLSEHKTRKAGDDTDLLTEMQRSASRCGVGESCPQRQSELETGVGEKPQIKNAWEGEPILEGRSNTPQPQRDVCESINQVRALSCNASKHVPEGRVCDGASADGSPDDRASTKQSGDGTSYQPRCDGQPSGEPHAICEQQGSQVVRARSGHKTSLVRVVPFHYTGKVWCLRVPTGAFVAVRNGVAFPTGNSGFPKSLDVGKAIDKAAGAEREVLGVVDTRGTYDGKERTSAAINTNWREAEGRGDVRDLSKKVITAAATEAAKQWDGWGTALKPAHEPIIVARKPLEGTVAANVLKYGTGALNIDASRVPHVTVGDGNLALNPHLRTHINGGNGGNIIRSEEARRVVTPDAGGRWPANVIHDSSDEVMEAFAEFGTTSSGAMKREVEAYDGENVTTFLRGRSGPSNQHGDSGSVARFFYCAKANKTDRAGSKHPTVKPIALMRYLVKLVTPPGGTVLDPFAGSGTTGQAAVEEGFDAVLIEREDTYVEDIQNRLTNVEVELKAA